jgi:hypothetical protein
MQISRTGTFVAGVVVMLIVGGGTAVASGGASLVLGKANPSKATTAIANSKGTPLSLTAKKGYPPLKVNSEVKVKHLDADLLDGKHASAFLDSAGTAANSNLLGGQPAGAFLGSSGTAANSTLLAGQPASAYLQSVYFATTQDTPQDPTLYHRTDFDLVTVPAGTYSVHLDAQVQNNDNARASVGCELAYREPAGLELGATGSLGLFSTTPGSDPVAGTVVVDQFITLPTSTNVTAFCYADEGDASHSAFVSHSALTATKLQDPHGTAEPFTLTIF